MQQRRIKIGDLLIQNGLITPEQLEAALENQKDADNDKKIGDIVIELGFVSEDDVCRILHEKLSVPIIDVQNVQISADAVNLIPRALAEKHCMVPIRIEGGLLVLAMADPVDYYVIDEMQLIARRQVRPMLSTPTRIRAAIERGYRQIVDSSVIDSINRSARVPDENDENTARMAAINERTENAPVVQLVNAILRQAKAMRASDIHVEPGAQTVQVRFRVDGELLTVMTLQLSLFSSLITRIKILAGIDIAEKRVPQDGRFTANVDNMPMQMRASTLPTIYGEKVVLRIFGDSAMQIRSTRELGMSEHEHERFARMLSAPSGIILVAGPTGSGKTTTLYAALCEILRPGINVSSIEDPVEKAIAGVNQVQVNPKAGLTFASGLRAMLRQDPDIIMIGEIRDSETASIATRAAITGHLVLSTIHTNDAASTFPRLIDMGVEPYMVAASMVGVLSQRLVRLLCPYCKREYTLNEPVRGLNQGEKLFHAVGCEHCNGTGYFGRTAIYEQILVSHETRKLVGSCATTDIIQAQVKNEAGYSSLRDNLIALLRAGKTTIEELDRLTYSIELV
ncbi:MAG: ATPase, T2SS/T4P/T4SS family [Clostridia bacterium]